MSYAILWKKNEWSIVERISFRSIVYIANTVRFFRSPCGILARENGAFASL
jgi:hypothetical protein